MSELLLRTKRKLRELTEYLPPLPRFPSPAKIRDWWREFRAHQHVRLFPRIPSPGEMKSWWRERREAIPTPNLPDLPSPRKMAQRFRERQSDEHRESLLPSLPRPGHVVAWFREHEGRRRILWATIGVIVLAAGTALAIRPATRGIKAWHARRLATRAATLIDQHQWNDAAAKLQDAYRLRNSEPEVWRMYARLLSRTGQGDMALQWWQKLGQVATLSLEDRRDFTAAALSASELGIAAEQVAHLLDQPGGPAPADLLLAAQFATMRGYVGTAQEFAQRVLDDARASSRDKLGADLVILANTTPDTQNYKNAAERLVELARDQENPAAPDALAVLGHQQRSDPLSVSPGSPLAIGAPEVKTVGEPIPLRDIAQRLETNPNSRPYHRMMALELYARAEPARADELVNRAMQLYGNSDGETLYALSVWLMRHRRYQSILDVLPLERAVQRRELLLEHIDALAALQRFDVIKQILLGEYPVLEPGFQHMYLAAVYHALGETTPSTNEWARALEEANSPRTLTALARFAEGKGELQIADAAYARLIQQQPELKSAYLARFKLAHRRGATVEAHDMAVEILHLWPEDQATRVRECYLRMLLAQAPDQLSAGESEAMQFLKQNPWDGVARSALAVAELRLGKSAAALQTFNEFNSRVPSSAISLPIYVAALAANGWTDKAREKARGLTTANILPEERALVGSFLK